MPSPQKSRRLGIPWPGFTGHQTLRTPWLLLTRFPERAEAVIPQAVPSSTSLRPGGLSSLFLRKCPDGSVKPFFLASGSARKLRYRKFRRLSDKRGVLD
jgi:hypothetical protein